MAINDKILTVKKSVLPGAGKGLFTKKTIPKGKRIVEYTGKIRTWKEVKNTEVDNPYIMYVNKNHIIDPSGHKKVKAKYANDAAGIQKIKGVVNNARYVKEGLRIFIESKVSIAAGSEILVAYGKEYWDAIKYNKKIG